MLQGEAYKGQFETRPVYATQPEPAPDTERAGVADGLADWLRNTANNCEETIFDEVNSTVLIGEANGDVYENLHRAAAMLTSAPRAGVMDDGYDPNELLRASMGLIKVGFMSCGKPAGDAILVDRIEQHLAALRPDGEPT